MKINFLVFLIITLCIACKKTDEPVIQPTPAITALNCSSTTVSNAPLTGIEYAGTITVPYEGGNGAKYAQGSPVSSTGVVGLTAVLQAGTLTNSSGNLSYSISGIASAA